MNILKNYCNVENIDMKNDGWDMNEFENLLKNKKIDFVYIMTNFQNPNRSEVGLLKKRRK